VVAWRRKGHSHGGRAAHLFPRFSYLAAEKPRRRR
jgi:hypothetical protein